MMRKLILSLAPAFIITGALAVDEIQTSTAENNCCNEECTCHWSYDMETKTIRVSGSGEMQDYERFTDGYHWWTDAPWIEYQHNAENVVIEGITRIGSQAFTNMDALKHAVVSEDVIKVGNLVFHGTSLETVSLPEHLQSLGSWVFADTDLKSVVIPEGITRIEPYIFTGTDLTSAVIPASVVYINEHAFYVTTEDTTPLETLYCAGGEQLKQCQKIIKPMTTKVIHYEKQGNDYLVYDDKGNVVGKYASAMNLNKGIATETYKYDSAGHLVGIFDGNGQRTWGKKIYTVEEAMEVTAKGDKFHVSLTYK